LQLLIYLLLGGTLGVFSRLFVLKRFKDTVGITINNVAKVNLISSFLAGIYIALNVNNHNIFVFFLIGYLGCFSTLSSFIVHLFLLLKEKKYIQFISHYIEVISYSILLSYIGHFTTKVILN